MATELYDASLLREQVISWIEAHEKWCRLVDLRPKDCADLFKLKSDIIDLKTDKFFLLADPKTKERIISFQPRWMGKSKGSPGWMAKSEGGGVDIEPGLVFEVQPMGEIITFGEIQERMIAFQPWWMGKSEGSPGWMRKSEGRGMDFEPEPVYEVKTKNKFITLGEWKGISVESESDLIEIGESGKSISKQELQVSKEQFMKLLASIFKHVAKLNRNMPKAETMVSPKCTFKIDLISSQFDEMWDEMHQLVSTELKVLAACMLTPLAGHISALRLISADMEWLCTWVPDFAQKLQCINIDEEIEEEMEDGDKIEESMFASYVSSWEQTRSRGYCCSFEDPTILSSMLFTHYKPGHAPFFSGATRTMQIFSIKVTILEGFEWPLEVYGVVAARDAVDYRRNFLFLRTRDDCQFLTEHDSFLHLTGPSRAIMSNDTVMIEVQLKVKGTTKSKDRALITRAFSCNGHHGDKVSTRSIDGYFCRIDLCCEHLGQSIQATILSVCVKEGSLPSKNGLQVVCSALPEEDVEDKAEHTSRHVVLLDQKDGTIPVDEEGHLDLSRQAVSVKLKGRLEVLVKTFPESGEIDGRVVFVPKSSNISKKRCVVGQCELEIIVAWSFLVDDQQPILMMNYTEPCTNTPFPFMNLDEDA